MGEIIRILIKSDLLTALTNGPKGVTNVGQPFWRGEAFSDVNYMHLLMLLVLIALFIAKRLKDSRTGRAWVAIREDETVAQATGVNTYRSKILALLLGAAFAGLAGALFASRNQFTGPEDFTMMVSINALCIVIVGGMGSLPARCIGCIRTPKACLSCYVSLKMYRLLVFGALLVVMMIVRPEGLWPAARAKFKKPSIKKVQEVATEVGKMTRAVIEAKNVTKRFGGLTAVDNVDLVVPEFSISSIIGPNGAGKTTLFNCVSGFYVPEEGEMLFSWPTDQRTADEQDLPAWDFPDLSEYSPV